MSGGAGSPAPTVLVVEDDPDLVWVVRFNLELEGYRTFVAANGEDALAMLDEVRPDLIMLDLMMPVMHGWAVLDALRRTRPRVYRILVVSARTGPEDKRRAQAYEVDGFIAKPFDMDHLLAEIRRILPRE